MKVYSHYYGASAANGIGTQAKSPQLDGAALDGAQNHLLIPMGDYRDGNICAGWRNTGVRRPKEYMAEYIRKNNAVGAVITVDVFVDCHGNFDPAQIEALRYIGAKVKE